MIILKKLTWSNCFSYGDNNSIDFTDSSLTQLIGENGSGKTSILLILQEVLYGKNIKNIKKQDIANRHTVRKGYEINLKFSKNDDEYEIDLKRKTSLKLVLLKNGEDISSHSSLNTYKTISEILGIPDFKTFSQLVYQSSTASLDFLTATDTNRKKFLISLLQLEKYTDLHEQFKKEIKVINDEINNLDGKLSVISSWIAKHEKTDLTPKETVDIPEYDIDEITEELVESKRKLNNIDSINKKITSNNEYKKQQNELDLDVLNWKTDTDLLDSEESLNKELQQIQKEMNPAENLVSKLETLSGKCPTCLQPISEEFVEEQLTQSYNTIKKCEEKIKEINNTLKSIKEEKARMRKKAITVEQFEKLNILIDKDLPTETEDRNSLKIKIRELTDQLDKKKKKIDNAVSYNAKVAEHNSKINVIKEQLEEYKENLEKITKRHSKLKDKYDIFDLLKKIFSTNGLVSYKIESSVKELEDCINDYLAEFTHFRIVFKLEKDKLNIEVIDFSGNQTNVENLSAGELGRVNIATVLAIRKIMSSLTSTKLNFLFLDEIVGVLDHEGKEKLTEILLKEDLNTLFVAHDFSHPLVAKTYIEKVDNISRIMEA
jgi:DNA repair exonuclease SbcCD ATPase subunit